MNGNLVETLIGAVVLVVAAAFLWFAATRANVGSVDGYSLIASFDKVDRISVGSDVMVGGIKVGTVTEQRLDPKTYLAVLTMSIRDDIKLPEDSSIKIAAAGLLGGNYLAIQPGGAEEYLENGGEFEFTQSAVDLTDLLGKAIYQSGPPAQKGAASGD